MHELGMFTGQFGFDFSAYVNPEPTKSVSPNMSTKPIQQQG